MTKLQLRALVSTVAMTGALLLSGCGASDADCQGDPGRVVEKDWDSNGKRADDYDVTVERADGRRYEKDVTSTAYDWVSKGSRWPSVKHCKDGKVK